ncbi:MULTISPECIES: hypothetical protein [unclassified Streptomyces]|uniref:hypothetical protein n=1 Tax=unclassified Streptomyces TaxID=2593676 RepID=UPI001661A0B9|nr:MULTISPECIES: hypothetical protein [unclassified Streptomyces]MBD0841723.1 hypothetical protein [Streptomyces sp. TRM68416]
MQIRIIRKRKPGVWLLYRDTERRSRRPVAQAPRLGLAGVDDDPAEFHIVRSID